MQGKRTDELQYVRLKLQYVGETCKGRGLMSYNM